MKALARNSVRGLRRRPCEPADADGLLALGLLECQVQRGERLFVLRYPSIAQSAQAPGGTAQFGGQLRFGSLRDGVASAGGGRLRAGPRQQDRRGAAPEG